MGVAIWVALRFSYHTTIPTPPLAFLTPCNCDKKTLGQPITKSTQVILVGHSLIIFFWGYQSNNLSKKKKKRVVLGILLLPPPFFWSSPPPVREVIYFRCQVISCHAWLVLGGMLSPLASEPNNQPAPV